jgi:hypothetical protein
VGVPNCQLWVVLVPGVPICFVLLAIISDVGPPEHVWPTRTWILEAHKPNKYDCLVIVGMGVQKTFGFGLLSVNYTNWAKTPILT